MTDITKVKDIIEAFGLINDLAIKIEALEASSASHTELIQGNAISDLNHYEANDKEIAELQNRIIDISELKTQMKLVLGVQTQINELKDRVEGVYKSVHGIAPDQADITTEVLRELKDNLFRFEERIYNHGIIPRPIGKTEKKEDSGGVKKPVSADLADLDELERRSKPPEELISEFVKDVTKDWRGMGWEEFLDYVEELKEKWEERLK